MTEQKHKIYTYQSIKFKTKEKQRFFSKCCDPNEFRHKRKKIITKIVVGS